MKITRRQLRRIIRKESNRVLNEQGLGRSPIDQQVAVWEEALNTKAQVLLDIINDDLSSISVRDKNIRQVLLTLERLWNESPAGAAELWDRMQTLHVSSHPDGLIGDIRGELANFGTKVGGDAVVRRFQSLADVPVPDQEGTHLPRVEDQGLSEEERMFLRQMAGNW